MEFINLFESEESSYWLYKLASCEWEPSHHLVEDIETNQFFDKFGKEAQLFLLVEGQEMVGHFTLAERDNVPSLPFGPWIGYVYVNPEFRGQKLFRQLLAHGEEIAMSRGVKDLYISSAHVNLYEQYGYTCIEETVDYKGRYTKVFHKRIN